MDKGTYFFTGVILGILMSAMVLAFTRSSNSNPITNYFDTYVGCMEELPGEVHQEFCQLLALQAAEVR